MATRFYMPSSNVPPDISPTPDATWVAGPISRIAALTTKRNSGYTTGGTTLSGAVSTDLLHHQLVSDKLAAQTITGTFDGFARCIEASSGLDLRAQVVVRVVSADGTVVRGTLVASDTGGLANEWGTSSGSARRFPRGGPVAVSSLAIQDGDRLVIEVGARKHSSSNGAQVVVRGDVSANGDITAEGEAATSSNPWFELSQTLTFYAPSKSRVSAMAANVVMGTWAGPPVTPPSTFEGWGVPL